MEKIKIEEKIKEINNQFGQGANNGEVSKETYLMVKPYFADKPEVVNFIKSIVEDELGLEIVEQGYIKYDRESAKKHYVNHVGKFYYSELEDYITSGRAYGMVVAGDHAIEKTRAAIKFIREYVPAMLGEEPRKTENVIHGSDEIPSAELEMAIFRNLLKLNKTR